MNRLIRTAMCVLVISFSVWGCTFHQELALEPAGLPERVYAFPMKNDFMRCRVAVFPFREPPNAPGVGTTASEALFEELLSRDVFLGVVLESDLSGLSMDDLVRTAHGKGYDLVIAGDLLYYFEGSLHEPSRVDERIQVIDAQSGEVLWYAKAMDVGPPLPDADYYVAQAPGVPAPTARTLLRRNAQKFSKMLLSLPDQGVESPAVRREANPGTMRQPL